MINYNTVQEIVDAGITNMECLRNNSSQDDGTDTVPGAAWLFFNGAVCTNVYVSGNSWLGFGSSSEHLKVNRRDAKMWYLYREEGTLYGQFDFLKIRWSGYSYYNQTSAAYKLTYDVIMFSNGVIMLHMVDIPTSSNDGTYSLAAASISQNYTVSLEQPDVTFYRTDGGYDIVNAIAVINKLFDIKYLIKNMNVLPEMVSHKRIDSLWLNTSMMTKDAGTAVAYTFPIVPGVKYTFECVTIGNRLRAGTTAADPSALTAGQSAPLVRSFTVLDDPVLPQKIEFIARKDEKHFVAHMSSDGVTPEVSIKALKDYELYTVADGHLVLLDTLDVSVDTFLAHGTDNLPPSDVLTGFRKLSVLCWQDSETVPSLSATVSATPPAQTVVTEFISLEDETILGVESVTTVETGSPLYALSFDGKATWEAWTGTAWATLDSATAGMSKTALESIAIDQWETKIDMLNLTGFHMKFILHDGDSVESVIVDFVN